MGDNEELHGADVGVQDGRVWQIDSLLHDSFQEGSYEKARGVIIGGSFSELVMDMSRRSCKECGLVRCQGRIWVQLAPLIVRNWGGGSILLYPSDGGFMLSQDS